MEIGPLTVHSAIPHRSPLPLGVHVAPPHRIVIETGDLGHWDSALIVFVEAVLAIGSRHKIDVSLSGLPEGVQRIIRLAHAVPERTGARKASSRDSWIEQAGVFAITQARSGVEQIAFVGEITIALGRLVRGQAIFQGGDCCN